MQSIIALLALAQPIFTKPMQPRCFSSESVIAFGLGPHPKLAQRRDKSSCGFWHSGNLVESRGHAIAMIHSPLPL